MKCGTDMSFVFMDHAVKFGRIYEITFLHMWCHVLKFQAEKYAIFNIFE